jgi:hypothetical protein
MSVKSVKTVLLVEDNLGDAGLLRRAGCCGRCVTPSLNDRGVERAIRLGGASHEKVAVLFLDLDGFKHIDALKID